MSAPYLKRLREFEAGDSRLKKMYADLSLLHLAYKDAVEKRAMRPELKKELVAIYAIFINFAKSAQHQRFICLPTNHNLWMQIALLFGIHILNN